VAGHRWFARIVRGKRAHFGVRHRFAVRCRELRGNLVRGEKIERCGWRCGEKLEGHNGAQ